MLQPEVDSDDETGSDASAENGAEADTDSDVGEISDEEEMLALKERPGFRDKKGSVTVVLMPVFFHIPNVPDDVCTDPI